MSKWPIVLSAAMVLVVASCGFASPQPTKVPRPIQPPLPSDAVIVEADILNFTHQVLEIKAGTTVRWTNRDPTLHTSTQTPTERGEEVVWDSARLEKGDSFYYTFNEPGTFRYICSIHIGRMIAVVTVTE